eukprot:TRINITY_DN15972_c0_g1::TRINITY_DN15972_c0_g1_i1::g.3749::m.3749 TRINITY_DN15972_c0_g1::TRINITY_DN15972_c0_g1_i1::g.3749  ORF type:complete len:249 (-),score=24.72,sp/Q95ZW1/GOSR1_CAEEL/31.33/3e-34,V-SNARE_C/PF12352.3/3.2e+02,V-SNARE_C/PF12352.3/1.7e-13,DASH_Dad4/PF08650.5/3.3e+03,DASH_Dad4/PF08650.5/0.36,CENP-Q/PF13094.1/2e+02,CENP-Q/PF13094.1/0.11,DUF342/PF03961.8/0.84,DUF342/PF03961.8/3e+02 TRINITY_DN15972_c0_g1_i1:294-980(-)
MAERIEWDSLRKKARTLETELDSKIVSLSKLTGGKQLFPDENEQEAERRLNSAEHVLMEIEALLTNLRTVNENMAQCTKLSIGGTSMVHTLQRRTEVLREFEGEYSKAKNTITQQKQSAELFQGYHKLTEGDEGFRERELLLRERSSLTSSDKLVDDVLNQAMATREALGNQRDLLGRVASKMDSMAQGVPGLNVLLSKIQYKKKKDTIIFAAIVAVCLVFLTIYLIG